jgi:hypothetical protein
MANPAHPDQSPAPRDGGNDPGGSRPARTSPLRSVLAFSFLNSLGTGAVQTGVFFLLQSAFGFGRLENYVFGLVLYGSYIAGALAAGPGLRRLAAALPWLSTRGVLTIVVLVQAAASLLPRAIMSTTGVATPPEWTVWAVGIAFGVFTGVMWPIVESYLSGGRSGARLNAATGRFNVLWSAAVLVSFWLMAPLIERAPVDVITALGVVQLASVALLGRFGREPARHIESEHEPHPAWWADLLAAFRVLLPLSYVVSGTLSPMLPAALIEAGVPLAWGPPVASAWLTARVVVFFVFERWAGWHGRAWMPAVAFVLLIGGFVGAVLAPRLGPAALPVLIGALAVFGAGHAMIYLGALYYAMEVGKAEVDAGGTHEALIGLGYGLGPAIGIGVLLASSRLSRGDEHAGPTGDFDTWLVGAVVALSAVAAALVWRSIRRKTE